MLGSQLGEDSRMTTLSWPLGKHPWGGGEGAPGRDKSSKRKNIQEGNYISLTRSRDGFQEKEVWF